MNAELFSIIAILGLILSAAGVFGVTSLAVASMQKEIGVRLAIGAGGRAITGLVLSRVSLAVGLGLGLGIAIALGGSKVAESLVWGISPMDPTSMGVGLLVLLLSVLVAVGVPLGRALTVDPVNTLRVE